MDDFFLSDKRSEIRELRAVMSCCVRCAMRFAGVRDPTAYQLPEQELEEAAAAVGAAEQAAAASSSNDDASAAAETAVVAPPEICPLCLGCLQHCLRPNAVERVANVVRAAGYESLDFSLAVSLPVQLMVRERGCWLHLQQTRAAAKAAEDGGGVPLIGDGRNQAATYAHHGDLRSPRFDAIVDVKDALRWALTPPLARALGLPNDPASALNLHVNLSHKGVDGEHHGLLASLVPAESAYNKRKRHNQGQAVEYDSIRVVQRALGMERADNLLRTSSKHCPPSSPGAPCVVSVTCERAPITLSGRYCKFARDLPQSPWIIDGARKCEGSVSECITDVLVPLYGASDARFHSAGREDVDVRMLGEGRPFLIELVSPKRALHSPEALAECIERINACGLMAISGLEVSDHAAVSEIMKEGEEAHRKDYRCVVCLGRPATAADVALLNGTKEVVCQQLTPMRVLHRRTLIVRERTVHSMSAVLLGSRFLQLDLTTQAGTYVKEFVHGDFGRTNPSLGSLLGCEADIMQLDVMGLHGDE